MTPESKQLLTRTFERLGPDSVARGLRAPMESLGSAWNNCFLALVYGRPGSLREAVQDFYSTFSTWNQAVGTLLGLPVNEVATVVNMFDHDYWTFRQLAEEWLELNRRQAVEPALTGYAVR